jgi:hypothetical protein
VLLVLLFGCGYGAPDFLRAPPGEAGDEDHDGYSLAEGDCDDGDPEISPAAAETCNGADDNCNGYVDEGVGETRYADRDGDGHGDRDRSEVRCAAEPGWSDEADDCDDSDANAFPGAEETCNGVDDDCDGNIDEGATTRRWVDADGDGYGDKFQPVDVCGEEPGTADNDDDCDDGDAAVNPAAAEAPGDGVDNDCDGAVDEA